MSRHFLARSSSHGYHMAGGGGSSVNCTVLCVGPSPQGTSTFGRPVGDVIPASDSESGWAGMCKGGAMTVRRRVLVPSGGKNEWHSVWPGVLLARCAS